MIWISDGYQNPNKSYSFGYNSQKKAHTKKNEEGKTVMSFASLMTELAGLCRLVLLPKTGADAGQKVTMLKTISPTQKWVFELLGIKPLDSFNSKN